MEGHSNLAWRCLWRIWRCRLLGISEQSGQRGLPSTARFLQSRYRLSSLRRWRSAARSAHPLLTLFPRGTAGSYPFTLSQLMGQGDLQDQPSIGH